MNISTASSMALVWLSAGVIQQYRNVYSQELKTQFSIKFGQIVTVMTGPLISFPLLRPILDRTMTITLTHLLSSSSVGLLVTCCLSLFVALFIALICSFSIVTAIISIIILSLGFLGMVCLS
jgi:hypothetical protein